MIIHSVFDEVFHPYGQVHAPFPVEEIMEGLKNTPVTDGVVYTAEDPVLQGLPSAEAVSAQLFGGMPVQMGWCNGHNTRLNCLEYHRDSEFNLGTNDFILLLARQEQIVHGVLDTAEVKAFRVPAGVMVEVYATTLHYAPCHTDSEKGFQVLVALPRGTNGTRPDVTSQGADGKLLWACNKWLLAHADSEEAKNGAFVALKGDNLDISGDI
ncbi:MAG: DUF4867 family protein [Clostridiales bacterium]|nr:DUF4867 family protein [Clostridiales bacterium]